MGIQCGVCYFSLFPHSVPIDSGSKFLKNGEEGWEEEQIGALLW